MMELVNRGAQPSLNQRHTRVLCEPTGIGPSDGSLCCRLSRMIDNFTVGWSAHARVIGRWGQYPIVDLFADELRLKLRAGIPQADHYGDWRNKINLLHDRVCTVHVHVRAAIGRVRMIDAEAHIP